MVTMTATEASRHFKDVLDRIEHGETVVVIRGGKRIALITPAPDPATALLAVLKNTPADPQWQDELAGLRGLLEVDERDWDGGQ